MVFQKSIPAKNLPLKIGSTDMKPYWKVVENIICQSDIVLEVLDARMPELSRNQEIEAMAVRFNKPLVLILNKADLVSQPNLRKMFRKYQMQYSVFIISSKEKIGTKRLREFLFNKSKNRNNFKIGVVGYPNTGKSSVINKIALRKKAKVTSTAGTTHGEQWINAGNNIQILDSPGVIPIKENDEIRLALIGSRNIEKIKRLDIVAHTIIMLFEDKTPIEKLYNIQAKSDNPQEIIQKIGRAKNYVKRGSLVDETRTEIQIIRDWQSGKLRL